jgi:hypothetical protein
MISPENIRLSAITCSDRRMDIVDTNYSLDTPINKYDVKCEACKFPAIDTTPDPYYLAKNRVFSGIEIMEADLGNLFVSDRLKKIFEIALPNNCSFQKTFIQGTNISTNWWLAIPRHTIVSGEVKNKVTRCKKCNEPLYAHPGSQYKFWIHDFEGDADIIKSKNWNSVNEKDWKKSWIGRDIFLSVRLISLLKKISVKGIYQQSGSKYTSLTKSEKQWVEDTISKIGTLAISSIRKDITAEDIAKLMKFLAVQKVNNKKVEYFENKFKTKSTELVKVLCSVDRPIIISAGVNETFKLAAVKDWELLKEHKKLIPFAFDDFGNSLQFDAKDKFCPIYYYDHETFNYELTHSSILNLMK